MDVNQVILAAIGPIITSLLTAMVVGIFKIAREMQQWKGQMEQFRIYVEAELQYNRRAHDAIRQQIHHDTRERLETVG